MSLISSSRISDSLLCFILIVSILTDAGLEVEGTAEAVEVAASEGVV